MNIKLRVANLVKKHGTSNPYLLADGLDISVFRIKLPMAIRGLLVKPLRRKIILLNEQLSDEAGKIVICHEIGHVRLHAGYGYHWHPDRAYFVPCRREREANLFAAHLISHSSHDIDSNLVAEIISSKMPDPKLVHQILTELILSKGA